jgi:4'-phosphopantetheinyl transferase
VKRLFESVDEPGHAWKPPPEAPVLDAGDVHVWRIPLDLPDALLRSADAMLDDAERARAARFHFDTNRARFVAGRAIQREVLARYLGIEPDDVRYHTNAFGKPGLAGDERTRLRFNFTNSGELGLLAIAAGNSVGIDIEKLRPLPAALHLAADWLSPREFAAIDTACPALRETMFFRCWTYKEAYLKARGERSLPLDVDYDDVAFAPDDEMAAMLQIGPAFSSSDAARWNLLALAPAVGYVGALAAAGVTGTRSQFAWGPPAGLSVGSMTNPSV